MTISDEKIQELKKIMEKGYEYFVDYMEGKGRNRDKTLINADDIRNGNIRDSVIHNLGTGETGPIIEINVPSKTCISIEKNEEFVMHLDDISTNTQIKIIIQRDKEQQAISSLEYGNFHFRFKNNILLFDGDIFMVKLISPDKDIEENRIDFNLSVDYWRK